MVDSIIDELFVPFYFLYVIDDITETHSQSAHGKSTLAYISLLFVTVFELRNSFVHETLEAGLVNSLIR